MSEQENKWLEEFEKWQNLDIEQFSGELKWKDINCSARDGFLAAKRQDAERIAELESCLAHYTRICEAGYSHGDYLDRCVELAELRAKLDAMEKQEPVGEVGIDTGYEDLSYGTKLYAKPVPATPAIPEGWQAGEDIRIFANAATGFDVGTASITALHIPSGLSFTSSRHRSMWMMRKEAIEGLRAMLAAATKLATNEGE